MSISKMVAQVTEFHKTFGLPISNSPTTVISAKEQRLRTNLLFEEVNETQTAMHNNDIIEIADGIVDSLYVIIGTAITYGLADKLDALFDEVHRSNMSKLGKGGKPIWDANGKVVKGPYFFLPNLGAILEK